MSYRSRIALVIKDNFAWVWYSYLYWINPTFPNHLKFRWYHYKFCKRRGEVFLLQLYLGQWKAYIEDMLIQHPKHIIPSHGLRAILEMINENKLEKLISFLESQSLDTGMANFIKELNTLNSADSGNITILPHFDQAHNSDFEDPALEMQTTTSEDNYTEPVSRFQDIHGRTWVIALHIYYQLFISLKEYSALTHTRAKYLEVIKAIFRVDEVKTKYKDINYNYLEILEKGTGSEKGQLRRQLKQIINNPSIFGERVVEYVKDILTSRFKEET